MRKFIISLFLFCFIIYHPTTTWAFPPVERTSFELVINGKIDDTTLYAQEGITLVPLRKIVENLDCQIGYNPEFKEITISTKNTQSYVQNPEIYRYFGIPLDQPSKEIKLTIDEKKATVNSKSVSLSVPPTIIDGVTYVPTRFVSENLGFYIYLSTITDENTSRKRIYIEPQQLFDLSQEKKLLNLGYYQTYTIAYSPNNQHQLYLISDRDFHTYIDQQNYISCGFANVLLPDKHTSKGITINDTIYDLIKAYGPSSQAYHHGKQYIFTYLENNYNPYNKQNHWLSFTVEEDGTISKILWDFIDQN